jgi:lipopolysaccharide biosynthesis glycosyltransferase
MLAIVLMVIVATRTIISVKQETKEILKELGTKGQTYDEIIRMLVEKASIKEMDKRWNRILEEEEFTELDEKIKEGIYMHYTEKKKPDW